VDSFSCFIRVSDCFCAFLNLFYNKYRVKQATHTTVIILNIIIMHKFSYIHYVQILHIKTHIKHLVLFPQGWNRGKYTTVE
jgi:hypothetical protein